MKNLTCCLIALAICLFSCSNDKSGETLNLKKHHAGLDLAPPEAPQHPKTLSIHEDDRIDNYYWLNDRENPDVIDYLNQENAYTAKVLAPTEDLQQNIYDEIVGRIKKDDNSVPYKDNGYYYYVRYEEGKEYRYFCRKKDELTSPEIVLLDENKLAEPYDYYAVGRRSVSPDNKILVYGEDTLSRRIYTLRFKNLETNEYYEDIITNTTGGATWANDNKTIFYTRKDDALRSFKIFKHVLGTPAGTDKEIFHEKDDTFGTFVYKTKSKEYIVIGSYSTLSSEFRILRADNPNGQFEIFHNRERNLEYNIDHYNDKFYVITNSDAKNFRLMETPVKRTKKDNWKEVIAHRDDVLLEGIDVFKDYLVLSERKAGITQLRVMPHGGDEHYIEFPEDAYLANSQSNYDFDTDKLRIGYQSMTTPHSVYDYNMQTKTLELLKRQEILGGFNKDDYTSERIMSTSRDGEKVPMSIVYKKGIVKDGNNPLLLYGYGSYGYSLNPTFSFSRLSLLDRGFIYVIAHIRGGQEMGRSWYEDGKLLNKTNTYKDFIDCGEYLIKEKYTNAGRMYAMGGSAGGLLMGAVINMRPDLFNGVIAAVPFVDVVTTMLDETIPLTTGEYDEWGNPNDEIYYNYIKAYSPYDNVEKKDYPSLLVTTGLHDSQVQYWEPAKWVAKLRELKTDKNPLLLHTNMEAGHGGASGRFRRHKETALNYAFLVSLDGQKIKG